MLKITCGICGFYNIYDLITPQIVMKAITECSSCNALLRCHIVDNLPTMIRKEVELRK